MIHTLTGLKPRPSVVPSDILTYMIHTLAGLKPRPSDVPQGFQSGPVPGTFTRLTSCIVPVEITEPPKISGGQNHKYDGR